MYQISSQHKVKGIVLLASILFICATLACSGSPGVQGPPGPPGPPGPAGPTVSYSESAIVVIPCEFEITQRNTQVNGSGFAPSMLTPAVS